MEDTTYRPQSTCSPGRQECGREERSWRGVTAWWPLTEFGLQTRSRVSKVTALRDAALDPSCSNGSSVPFQDPVWSRAVRLAGWLVVFGTEGGNPRRRRCAGQLTPTGQNARAQLPDGSHQGFQTVMRTTSWPNSRFFDSCKYDFSECFHSRNLVPTEKFKCRNDL